VSLAVVRVLGLSTVQDLGVHGYMHEALPPGGALVPELLALANRAAQNPDGAIAVEVQGRLVVRAMTRVLVAIDDQPARVLEPGTELEIVSGARRCAYLAVHGGVVGTLSQARRRGDLVSAGIGRPLVAGATLDVGDALASSAPPARFVDGDTQTTTAQPARFVDGDIVTIIPGPDLDAFTDDALASLVSAPYRILPASNRVGTRLAGPVLPRRADYRERSRPMVIGALEVPRDGQPIALGPEHPTTGGYPRFSVRVTSSR
jgi:5-oxoprolinase (ATP-hydrolysing) subunit C